MASWEDTALALSPVFFGRLDELTGTTITDISGNGHDGTYDVAAQLGFASPIETDAASHAVKGVVGRVPAPALGQLDLLSNFTRIIWMYYDPDAMLANSSHGLNRRGQFGLSHNVQLGINSNQIMADVTLDTGGSGTFYRLIANAVLVPKTWYMLADMRNGAVFRLYVNGDLAQGNERTDLTADQVDYNVDGSDWFIGRSINTSAFAGVGIDEVLLFDYALSAAQILALYESAINQTLLQGFSNVVSTATLDSTEDPLPVQFPFRHNWDSPFIERLSFFTNLSKARDANEEAGMVRSRPRREIEFIHVIRSDSERRVLRAKLWAGQAGRWFVPVFNDFAQLAAPLAAGATTLPVATTHMDYAVGGYVGVRQRNDAGAILHAEVAGITAVNLASVEIDTPLAHDYPAHLSFVYPVRRALLTDAIDIRGHTDAVEEMTLQARLLAEDEPAAPNRITPWTPTLMRLGYEVFDPSVWRSHDWSDLREYNLERSLDSVDMDAGVFSTVSDTDGASESFTYRMVLNGRTNIAAFLGWFYGRAGSLNYLWVATMQRDVEVLAVSGNVLQVTGTDFFDNYIGSEARRDVAFIYHDNSMVIRRVLHSDGLSPDETLELDDDVPTLVNLRSLSFLKFCRMDGDQLEIAWETNETAQMAWRFREMLTSPPGVGTHSLSPSASQSPSVSPSSSASRSASPSGSQSPSSSGSPTPSASPSPSGSVSPSASVSPSLSPSASASPSV